THWRKSWPTLARRDLRGGSALFVSTTTRLAGRTSISSGWSCRAHFALTILLHICGCIGN
ncbi:hypothetical protein B0H14DRAFT_3854365, partial [Mycena olivaceomarginata]